MKPYMVHLELTNKCNLSCTKCSVNNGMKRAKMNMSFSLIEKIVNQNPQIRSYGLNNWGEPLLHPRFIDIIDYLTRKGRTFFFATNASFLTKELSQHLLSSGNLETILFSMDGVDEEYEQYHGQPYSVVEKNLTEFLSLRSKLGKKPEARIVTTIFPDNESSFDKLKSRWESKLPIITQPLLKFSLDARHGKCAQLNGEHVVVLSNGNVVPCCADVEGKMIMGDAKSCSLNSIVSSSCSEPIMRGNSSVCNNCSEYKTKLAKARFKTCTPLKRQIFSKFSSLRFSLHQK